MAGRILLAVWAAGAGGVLLASSDGLNGFGWRTAAMIGSSILAGALAGWTYRRQIVGTLQFDGHNWTLGGARPTPAGRLVAALDLQSLLLVRLGGAGWRTRWLWLERGSDPQQWLALRRAVYSRAPSADTAGPITAVQRSTGSIPSSS